MKQNFVHGGDFMKFIHCADIHLGSALTSHFGKEKADLRKREIRTAFSSMVDYAREENIPVILLCGDVFDSDRPSKKDKEFFYQVVKNNPTIDFLYLRGNHDQRSAYDQELPNLKTFGSRWQSYRYGDVAIWGLEADETNEAALYSGLQVDSSCKNIVMLHGQISDCTGKDCICLPRLREKYIDYLALGHIHSFECKRLDSRGVWCYSGCLEGRGYDETGEKGFVVLDSDNLSQPVFVKRSRRLIRRLELDLTGCEDEYQALRYIQQELPPAAEDLLRLELVGETDWDASDLSGELEPVLEGRYFHHSIKNRTLRSFHLEDYSQEISLAGEFVRRVLALEGYTEEERRQIIDLGLRALDGREVAQ